MTFVCIICGQVGWRCDGRPVNDDKYPSWRCADAEACGRRYLAVDEFVDGTQYEPRHANG